MPSNVVVSKSGKIIKYVEGGKKYQELTGKKYREVEVGYEVQTKNGKVQRYAQKGKGQVEVTSVEPERTETILTSEVQQPAQVQSAQPSSYQYRQMFSEPSIPKPYSYADLMQTRAIEQKGIRLSEKETELASRGQIKEKSIVMPSGDSILYLKDTGQKQRDTYSYIAPAGAGALATDIIGGITPQKSAPNLYEKGESYIGTKIATQKYWQYQIDKDIGLGYHENIKGQTLGEFQSKIFGKPYVEKVAPFTLGVQKGVVSQYVERPIESAGIISNSAGVSAGAGMLGQALPKTIPMIKFAGYSALGVAGGITAYNVVTAPTLEQSGYALGRDVSRTGLMFLGGSVGSQFPKKVTPLKVDTSYYKAPNANIATQKGTLTIGGKQGKLFQVNIGETSYQTIKFIDATTVIKSTPAGSYYKTTGLKGNILAKGFTPRTILPTETSFKTKRISENYFQDIPNYKSNEMGIYRRPTTLNLREQYKTTGTITGKKVSGISQETLSGEFNIRSVFGLKGTATPTLKILKTENLQTGQGFRGIDIRPAKFVKGKTPPLPKDIRTFSTNQNILRQFTQIGTRQAQIGITTSETTGTIKYQKGFINMGKSAQLSTFAPPKQLQQQYTKITMRKPEIMTELPTLRTESYSSILTKQQIGVIPLSKITQKQIPMERAKTLQMQTQMQKPMQIPTQTQIVKTQQITIPQQITTQRLQTIQRLQQIQTPITEPPPPQIPNIIIPTIITPPIITGGFNFGAGMGDFGFKRTSRKGKRKFRYTPQLYAQALGIYSTKQQKRLAERTGLSVRGL